MKTFRDRRDAGEQLGRAIRDVLEPEAATVVFGVARGGVIPAREVARTLAVPLDVVVTRKVGAPGNAELGIGAVDEDGIAMIDDHTVARLGIPRAYIDEEIKRQTREVHRRLAEYRQGRRGADPAGRVCVVVDDGIATGGTLRSAVALLRRHGALKVLLAVPVASREGLSVVGPDADAIVCLSSPSDFAAVGQWYEEFPQVDDEQVIAALRETASTSE